MSNTQVVNHFRSSHVAIELEMYWSNRNTVGYTYENVKKVWMNKKFHNNYSVCQVASNLGHEAAHKIGFGHDTKATVMRKYSVPYTMNEVVMECCTND